MTTYTKLFGRGDERGRKGVKGRGRTGEDEGEKMGWKKGNEERGGNRAIGAQSSFN